MNPKSAMIETPAYVTKNRIRPDANRIALGAVRAILNAAKPTRVDIEGITLDIRVKRLSRGAWPQNTWGVDETQDGPWPRPVPFDCSWPGGKTQLVASVEIAGKQQFPMISLQFRSSLAKRQIVWINVAAWLRQDAKEEVPFTAWASLTKHIPQDKEGKLRLDARRAKIIALLRQSQLPLAGPSSVNAFQIRLANGHVLPSPEEAMQRLVHVALLKQPFWVPNHHDAIEGKPYLDPEAYVPGEDDVDAEEDVGNELEAEEEDTQVEHNHANPHTSVSPSVKSYSIDDIINDGCFIDRAKLDAILAQLRTKKNLILQGPPGTGKSWLAKRLGFALMGAQDPQRLRAVQFHPNLSCEDFVRGHRPASGGTLDLVDGPFLNMIAAARSLPNVPHVFVIEEINRGNPAQIFSEMLTLLEADKRKPEEALELCYPREKGERIHIPNNLYVIGTMNIADRSIAPLDMALRRRFAFIDLEPSFGQTWRD